MRSPLAALALLAPALACTVPNPYLNRCGNGVFEPLNGEECDDGEENGDAAACTAECRVALCGDGLVQAGVEECDKGDQNNDQGSCTTLCKPPACGDGIRQYTEECDDGPLNRWPDDGKGGCSIQCSFLSACGDGVTNPHFEECDDANDVETDACTSACKAAVCGDGFVHAGVEACDDGNADDSDSCTNACEFATCGDGIVQPQSEECDDGNDANDDGCLNACIAAKCGDGVLRTGVEECDDGNLDPEDGCNDVCARDRLVFLADILLAPAEVTGIDGADTECSKIAQANGHPEPLSFWAWISDGVMSPDSRFYHAKGRYVLSTGQVIAENWDDLVDGALAHPIDRTFDGKLLDNEPVWTAVRADGTGYDDSTCEGWSTTDPELKARWGYSGSSDAGWTDRGEPLANCGTAAMLYCFEFGE
ncbi:MAG: DUF4215 domain-containing protein [Nannocystaceae bacterium]